MANSASVGVRVSAGGDVCGDATGSELALSGPSTCGDRTRLPLRGDLAHIRLAGRCFVPHYAVPMAHKVTLLIWLRSKPKLSADELCEVTVGTHFNVLDISGDWAWGQIGEDGMVGYMPMGNLRAI